MKKIYCVICGNYRKSENPKISYIFEKTLVTFFICNKCGNKHKRIFKEEEPIEISKILGLNNDIQLFHRII